MCPGGGAYVGSRPSFRHKKIFIEFAQGRLKTIYINTFKQWARFRARWPPRESMFNWVNDVKSWRQRGIDGASDAFCFKSGKFELHDAFGIMSLHLNRLGSQCHSRASYLHKSVEVCGMYPLVDSNQNIRCYVLTHTDLGSDPNTVKS